MQNVSCTHKLEIIHKRRHKKMKKERGDSAHFLLSLNIASREGGGGVNSHFHVTSFMDDPSYHAIFLAKNVSYRHKKLTLLAWKVSYSTYNTCNIIYIDKIL